MVKRLLVALTLTALFVFVMNARADARPRHHYYSDASGNSAIIIGARPSGCPHAYCGCGLRQFLGLRDVRLNLARNWARLFPRTSARPGAVAVRTHHVFMLVSHVAADTWVVRDYNSGHGLSRIHQRSVRGYTFVSPTQTVGDQLAFSSQASDGNSNY